MPALLVASRAPRSLALALVWLWPAVALATKPCPDGTYPSVAWRLVPVGILVCSVALGWLATRWLRGPWGKLLCAVIVVFGLGLAFLALIIPGPCVS